MQKNRPPQCFSGIFLPLLCCRYWQSDEFINTRPLQSLLYHQLYSPKYFFLSTDVFCSLCLMQNVSATVQKKKCFSFRAHSVVAQLIKLNVPFFHIIFSGNFDLYSTYRFQNIFLFGLYLCKYYKYCIYYNRDAPFIASPFSLLCLECSLKKSPFSGNTETSQCPCFRWVIHHVISKKMQK